MSDQTIKYIRLADAIKKDSEDEKKTIYNNDSEVVIKRTRDKKILSVSLAIVLLICSVILMIIVIQKYVALYDTTSDSAITQ